MAYQRKTDGQVGEINRRAKGFPDRLNATLKALSLSKHELAERMGVAPTSVLNWTNFNYQPKASMLLHLADKLEVDPRWLMLGDDE